ncbi:MAG: type I DNA topoisomerase, partial [Deltaproteobacteria bacterium]
ELAVYTLVWNRFVASQMASAVFDATAVDIEVGDCRFRATGQILKFDGFIRVYTEGRDDEQPSEEEGEGQLPPLAEGDVLRLLDLVPEQHFTQPPPRFTQATLIKELEEDGIGRPSTYASIVGTILNREYVVEDEQKRLRPTELGFLVTDLLVESFPDVLNVEFTAGMEGQLDAIEEGREHWVAAMRRFWEPFSRDLEKADVEMRDVKREERPTDLACEKCGKPMVIKWGRRGEFLACSGYPECKNTKNFTREEDGTIRPAEVETTDEVCEKCGRPMQVRFGRYGKFLGCSGYPECSNMQPLHKPVPTGVKCLQCGEGEMMERRSRRGKLFYSCSRYPDCQCVAWDRPIPEPCPACGAGFVTEKVTKRYGTVRRCVKAECGWQTQVDDGSGEYAPLPARSAAAKVSPRRRTAGDGAGRPAARRRASSR